MVACPSDDAFARLIEGTLPADRIGQLEAHCDACPACGRALAELARTLAPDRGDWLGERYRLLEPLGAGGMGLVYTAFDTKLQRKVAVKRLREAGGSASMERRRVRFLREAQLLASLSHPNVLTVHDVGGLDPELYVVMELVDGWPMSRWISEAQPRPGWRQIIDMYLQVGRGLSAAHQLGVVHRDVKPENILVARSGRVLIGDFGLAGLTDAREAAADSSAGPVGLTQTGTVLGTPAYMAPEQHDGKPSDALSDQFSFSVSLYESLHGRRPFPGQTAAEIAAAVRLGRLPPGGDGVPRPVDRVLATGLAADPVRRHPSMDALLAALTRARDRRPVPPLLAAGALIALLAAGTAVAILRQRSGSTPGPPGPMAVNVPPSPAPAATPPAPELAAESKPAGNPAPRPPAKRDLPGKDAAGEARARNWARVHPEADPKLLLYFADRAHGDRDGAACLTALNQIPTNVWPAALADRALRRRATCEMLRGKCGEGHRLLARLDGARGARGALLANCPPGSLTTVDDRILAVSAQADEARYAGNQRTRRDALKQILLRQTASPEMQRCFRTRSASRACGRRLTSLARAFQVLAESFLVGGDCREGAQLDVMRSQVKFQSQQPDEGDPALRCRSERIFAGYKSCAAAGEEAERRCLARIQAARREGASVVLPELGR